jgi:phage shock protein PspC (stress-responsive transcriptional regulator)
MVSELPLPDDAAMDATDTTTADAPDPEPEAGSHPRRLVRSADDRLVAGVAGGIAEHYGIESMYVRLGFIVATFFGGLGALAYFVLWIVLPVSASAPVARPKVDRRQLLGYALVAVGLLVIPVHLGLEFRPNGSFWPLALIAVGVAVLLLRMRDVRDAPDAPPPDAPPPGSPPGPGSSATDALTLPAARTAVTAEMPTTPRTALVPAIPATPATPDPARRKSHLGAITWSALLLLGGGAWLLDRAGLDIDIGVVFALGLAVVGAALVTSAWYGRSRGLILLGLPLVLVIAALGVVDLPLRGGIGAPTYRPATVAAVHHRYELAIGDLSVDLGGVDFAGTTRHVEARLGIGQVNVTVPDDVRVVVDAHANAGSITAFGGNTRDCCPTDLDLVERGVPGGGTLYVDAQVGAGNIRIKHEEQIRGTS